MRETIATTIAESALLGHLPADKLDAVAQSATLEIFDAGAVLIQEGQPTHTLFLLVDGLIDVSTESTGRVVALTSLGPGSYVGEVSALSGKPATATVTARTPTRAVLIPRATVVSLVEEDEQVRSLLEGVTLARARDTLGKVLKS